MGIERTGHLNPPSPCGRELEGGVHCAPSPRPSPSRGEGVSDDEATLLAAFKLLGLGFGALATASMAKLFAPGETRTEAEMIIGDAESAAEAGSPEQWEEIFKRLDKLPKGEERDTAEVHVLNRWPTTNEFFRKLSWSLLELNGLLEGKNKPINVIGGPISSFLREGVPTDPDLTVSDRSKVMFEITSLFEMLVKTKMGMEPNFLRSTMIGLYENIHAILRQEEHVKARSNLVDSLLNRATSELQRVFLLKLGLSDPRTGMEDLSSLLHYVTLSEPHGSALKEIVDKLFAGNEGAWEEMRMKDGFEKLISSSMKDWIEGEIKPIDTEATRKSLQRLNLIAKEHAEGVLRRERTRRKYGL